MSMRQTSLFSFIKKTDASKPPVQSDNLDEADIVPDTPESKLNSKPSLSKRPINNRLSRNKIGKPKKQEKSKYDGFNYSPFDQASTSSTNDVALTADRDIVSIIDLSADEPAEDDLIEEKSNKAVEEKSPKAKRRRLLQEVRQHCSKKDSATSSSCPKIDKLNDGESEVLKALIGEMSSSREIDKPATKPKKRSKNFLKLDDTKNEALETVLSDLLVENEVAEPDGIKEKCNISTKSINMGNGEKNFDTTVSGQNVPRETSNTNKLQISKKDEKTKSDGVGRGDEEISYVESTSTTSVYFQESKNEEKVGVKDHNFVVVPETQEMEEGFGLSDSMCDMFNDSFTAESDTSRELPNFLRGKIVNSTRNREYTSLTVEEQSTGVRRDVKLRGFWADSTFAQGDIVHVIDAVKESHLEVDDKQGFLVVSPDWLVSGTTVVSGMRCLRNIVLQQRHCVSGAGNRAMMLGSLVHAVFQQMIKRSNQDLTVNKCREVAMECLRSGRMLESLCLLGAESSEILKDFDIYASQIVTWIKKHRHPHAPMRLQKVIDIEESVWSPWYGIKGNIDLTVEVQKSNEQRRIMPLELKSGRTTFSSEHTGQVILYTMLLEHSLSTCSETIDAGWLVYLKDGASKEVRADANLKRGLIQLRNDLVNSLRRTIRQTNDELELDVLPPVINDRRWCEKCPQLLSCGLYARYSQESNTLPADHGLLSLFDSTLGHLQKEDIAFFAHWTLLSLIEAKADSPAENVMASMHRSRDKLRDCIAEASLEKEEVNKDGSGYFLTFGFKKEFDFIYTTGDFVIVSTNDGRFVGLCQGSVVDVTSCQLILSSERTVRVTDGNSIFRIDRYSSQKIHQMAMGNILSLMTDCVLCERLRKFIIHYQKPQLEGSLSKSTVVRIRPLMKALNQEQRTAILKVLMAKDYVLIRGYPGSGKSSVITTLIRVAMVLSQRVLLVSHTHSAVDNVLVKLSQYSKDIIRLGKANRVHTDLKEYVFDADECKSETEYRERIESKSVVGATCLTASTHPALTLLTFDLVIVDEAGQVTVPTALGPLLRLAPEGRFVLVGDSAQLPPTVRSMDAIQLGLCTSLLERLEKSAGSAVTSLKTQYRMNGAVVQLCNGLMYEGEVKCATEELEKNTLREHFPDVLWDSLDFTTGDEPWKRRVCSPTIDDAVLFLNTEARDWHSEKDERNSLFNSGEVNVVGEILNLFEKLQIPAKDIGVISPYRAQVRKIRDLPNCSSELEVNTIDQYQGRDKSIILISLVRTNEAEAGTVRKNDILEDARRINVAVSRAKLKCVLIGNIPYLRRYAPFRKIFEILSNSQVIAI